MPKPRYIQFKFNGASRMIYKLAGTYVSEVVDGLEDVTEYVVERNVTAAATDAGDTLAMYVQTSFDKGVTWVDLARFPDVAGNAAVPVKAQWCGGYNGDGDVAIFAAVDAGLAANTNVDLMHGDRLRLKVVITDADSNSSWTVTCSGWTRGSTFA